MAEGVKERKLSKIVVDVLLAVTLTVLASLVMTKATTRRPSVFGFRAFYIMSGSMEPTIETGQLVLAHAIEPEDVEIGDIIAYDREGKTIIHRVVDIVETSDGNAFIFKGDNNEFRDAPVSEEQILYKVVLY